MRVQPDGWLSRARTHTARRDSTDACSLNTSVKHARHTVHNRDVAEWPRCDESVNRPRTQRHTRVDRLTATRHGRVITGRDGCGFHADTDCPTAACNKQGLCTDTRASRQSCHVRLRESRDREWTEWRAERRRETRSTDYSCIYRLQYTVYVCTLGIPTSTTARANYSRPAHY